MAEAKIDNNNISTIQGVLNTDGVTPTNVTIDPITHVLDISDDTTGNDFGNDWAARDNNHKPTLIAASENDDNTPVTLYVDSNGYFLIDST